MYDIRTTTSGQVQQKDLVLTISFDVATSGQGPQDKYNKKTLSGQAFLMYDIRTTTSGQVQQKDLVLTISFDVATSGQGPQDKDNKKTLSGQAF